MKELHLVFGTALWLIPTVGLTWLLIHEWRYHVRITRAWQAGYENGLLMTGLPFPLEDDMRIVRAFNDGYRTGLSERRVRGLKHGAIAEPKRTRSAGWTRVMDYMK